MPSLCRSFKMVIDLGHIREVPDNLPTGSLPFDISSHPAVRHTVGRFCRKVSSFDRMEAEMLRFAEMQKKTPAPKVKQLSEENKLNLTSCQAVARKQLKQLRRPQKAADAAFVDALTMEVLLRVATQLTCRNWKKMAREGNKWRCPGGFCASPVPWATNQMNQKRSKMFHVLVAAGRSLLSSSAEDWQRINLFLPENEVRDILQLTSHAMLRAVRVVLANGSLAEARDQKMLMKGGPLCGAGGG